MEFMTQPHSDMVEMQLLSCRCLSNLIEALPGPSTHFAFMKHDVVEVLCEKLLSVECIDVAEHAIALLNLLSRRHAKRIIRARGVGVFLHYVDFFSMRTQQLAVECVSNLMVKMDGEDAERCVDVLPALGKLMRSHDAKLVELSVDAIYGCIARLRTLDRTSSSPHVLPLLSSLEPLVPLIFHALSSLPPAQFSLMLKALRWCLCFIQPDISSFETEILGCVERDENAIGLLVIYLSCQKLTVEESWWEWGRTRVFPPPTTSPPSTFENEDVSVNIFTPLIPTPSLYKIASGVCAVAGVTVDSTNRLACLACLVRCVERGAQDWEEGDAISLFAMRTLVKELMSGGEGGWHGNVFSCMTVHHALCICLLMVQKGNVVTLHHLSLSAHLLVVLENCSRSLSGENLSSQQSAGEMATQLMEKAQNPPICTISSQPFSDASSDSCVESVDADVAKSRTTPPTEPPSPVELSRAPSLQMIGAVSGVARELQHLLTTQMITATPLLANLRLLHVTNGENFDTWRQVFALLMKKGFTAHELIHANLIQPLIHLFRRSCPTATSNESDEALLVAASHPLIQQMISLCHQIIQSECFQLPPPTLVSLEDRRVRDVNSTCLTVWIIRFA